MKLESSGRNYGNENILMGRKGTENVLVDRMMALERNLEGLYGGKEQVKFKNKGTVSQTQRAVKSGKEGNEKLSEFGGSVGRGGRIGSWRVRSKHGSRCVGNRRRGSGELKEGQGESIDGI
jgi:hypothetical protein